MKVGWEKGFLQAGYYRTKSGEIEIENKEDYENLLLESQSNGATGDPCKRHFRGSVTEEGIEIG